MKIEQKSRMKTFLEKVEKYESQCTKLKLNRDEYSTT